jgi:hypothetical protein
MTDAIFFIVFIADLIGLFAIIGALFRPHVQVQFPAWHKAGMIVIAVALLFQGAFCLTALVTGVQPALSVFPWWALKDIGFATIGGGYAWHYYTDFKCRQRMKQELAESLAALSEIKGRAPAKKSTAKKVAAKKTTVRKAKTA